MRPSTLNVLFLGPRNAARSVMAEAITNRLGAGRFCAFSGGWSPEGRVHPYALDVLRMQNYALDGVRCKSWYEFARSFARPQAPDIDFVFSLCDTAFNVSAPTWPGQPVVAHWRIADPALAEGSEAEKRCAFTECHRLLYQRISVFASLPLASLSRFALLEQVAHIGRQFDETAA